MKPTHNRLFLNFSLLSFSLMLLFALALAWVIGNGLGHQIALLHAHADAITEGMAPLPDAPYSIAGVERFSHRLLSLVFDTVAVGSILIYAVLIALVWRGGRAIQAPDAGSTGRPGTGSEPRNPARTALRWAMLLEFSGLGFGLMLLLGTSLAWLIGYGFSQQLYLIGAHGRLMHGMHDMQGMDDILRTVMTTLDAPYSLASIERAAHWLMIKGFAAVAVGSLVAYGALLLLVRRGWRKMLAYETRWN